MNRDIASVLFKPLKAPSAAATGDARVFAPHTETTADVVATKLKEAKSVVIVPGYGLAVAKAQCAVAEIAAKLQPYAPEAATPRCRKAATLCVGGRDLVHLAQEAEKLIDARDVAVAAQRGQRRIGTAEQRGGGILDGEHP